MTGTCAMCGEPMHRYGFPSDGQHDPDATACVNGLLAKLERLEARAAHQYAVRDKHGGDLRRIENHARFFDSATEAMLVQWTNPGSWVIRRPVGEWERVEFDIGERVTASEPEESTR